MTLTEAIILGIVQGATEFLPVSSSAHLLIVPALAGWADPGAAFTAVIQCGTLVAILGYFRADVLRIATAWVRELFARTFWRSLDARMGWLIIVGTVPIVAGGLLLKPLIETKFRSLYVIAAMLIGVGLLMLVAELFAWRRARSIAPRDMDRVDLPDAVTVGLAQMLALVPGTSRSGITIVAGLFRGLTREAAARFSFLLSLPAVFAAAVHELYHERAGLLKATEGPVNLLVATVVAGVVGYLSIALLLAYVRHHATTVFVVYRLLLAAVLLAMLSTGRLADTGPQAGKKDEGGLPRAQPRGRMQAEKATAEIADPLLRQSVEQQLMSENHAWRYVNHGIEGHPLLIQGVNVWDHDWKRTSEPPVTVEDPHYHERHVFDIYEVEADGVRIRFVAGEFSNLVYGFYQQ